MKFFSGYHSLPIAVLMASCTLGITHVSAEVLCGGHYAATCQDCPKGSNGEWFGAVWCNGECVWDGSSNQCLPDNKDCGDGFRATSCSECSQSSPCSSADCTWHTQTSLCRDAFSDDIRTASVHLVYNPPISQPAWWFQKVVPVATEDATYFSTSQHSYGYGGIQQVDANTGRVIFSLWDQGGCDQDVDPDCDPANLAQTVVCGDGVSCTGFGGEGTGRKSYFDVLGGGFPAVDQEYYFVSQAAYLGNRRMEYTGYFYLNGTWRLLSRIQVSTNVNEEWWHRGLVSFVEQWTNVDTTKDRGALFGPSYLAETDGQELVQIDSAWFSHGTLENHERVNAWQAGPEYDYAIGIETGGNAEPEVTYGASFSYPNVPPSQEMLGFQQKIPCLNAATSKEDIEACLEQGPPAPCQDAKNWRFKKSKGKNRIKFCGWVAKRPKNRCKKVGYFIGDEGTPVGASVGCPEACNKCPSTRH